MPGEDKTVLFAAEFEGQGIAKGVEDILTNLEKVQEAQVLLKQSTKETTKAMQENRKEFEKVSKQVAIGQHEMEEQRKKVDQLNAEYDQLTENLTDLTIAQKKVNEVGKQYQKQQREQIRDQEKINKAVGKFTSVNELAADGIRKFGNHAKDAAFSIVSGFAGGIIATVIPTIFDFVGSLFDGEDALEKMSAKQKLLNKVFEEGSKQAADQTAKVLVYKEKLNDTNLSQTERIKIAKEYNKIADEGNKIDLKQIDNLALINKELDQQIQLILKRAIAQAAMNQIAEKANRAIEAELKFQDQLKRDKVKEEDVVASPVALFGNTGFNRQAQNRALTDEQKRLRKVKENLSLLKQVRNDTKQDLLQTIELLNPFLTTDAIVSPTKTTAKIENVFEQKLRELKARLESLTATVFESESNIRKKFRAQLEKEIGSINELFKDKKLTGDQAEILRNVLRQINQVEISKGLEEFKKKRLEAMNKVNDLLIAAEVEAGTKRINNIRDEFEREGQQIDESFIVAVEAIKKRQAELFKQIKDDTEKGLLSPEFARRKRFIAALVYGDLIDQAETARNNAKADLAFKTFQKTLEEAKKPFQEAILGDNEETTRLIRLQTGLFLEGKISYEKYQKNLTEIIQSESRKRRKVQLEEAEEALRLIELQLGNTTDQKQREQLERQRDALRGQISALKREIATGAGGDQNDAEKKRIDQILNYVNAVQSLANAVLSFWQQVNQAEAAALDRSIALQNRRVDNARDIAEKGNAEYLELEQKRLDELTRKREENARKQLAINNALTTSQAFVAAISAIAQAAQSGNPLAIIAAVGAVIGAIGAAYQFVNSMQPQEANFFTGTSFVQGPEGRDKVKANLTKGERVTTVKENKDYWETLEAVHNRTIPPEVLNSFVEAYPNLPVPLVDFERLSSATENKVGADSMETLNRLDTLNDTMGQVVIGLQELGINVNMDEDGFEASISRARKRRLIRKRA